MTQTEAPMDTMTRTLTVRIDTIRTDRTTGETISRWEMSYSCNARRPGVDGRSASKAAPTQQAADVLRTHHTREAQPDGTWKTRRPDPQRPSEVTLDTIDWQETATLVGDWTDAERAEVRRIVERDRHLPGGG